MVYKGDFTGYQAKSEAAHEAALAKFTADAKKADEQLTKIANQDDISAKEKGKKIEAIISGLPQNVRDEIEKAMKADD